MTLKASISSFYINVLHLRETRHDGEKIREIDCTVVISMDFINHVLELSLGRVLTQASHDITEFLDVYAAITILIIERENILEFFNLFSGQRVEFLFNLGFLFDVQIIFIPYSLSFHKHTMHLISR